MSTGGSDASDDLLLRYLDGKLEGDEEGRLRELVATDPAARARLRLHATVEEFLEENAVSGGDLLAKETPSPVPARQGTLRGLLPWGIALAATVVACAALLHDRKGGNPADGAGPADDPDLAALLVNEASARFSDDAGPDGFRFVPGDYHLQAGAAHLRFASGADLVVAAPARFRIDDSLHLELQEGDIRVFAPPSAHGFTVATGDVELVDYGTEFGVSADPEEAFRDLVVFEGRVDARQRGGDGELGSVLGGEAMRFGEGGARPLKDEEVTASFPSPEDIGLLRWRASQEQLLGDPALLVHFPFESAGAGRDASQVDNAAPGSLSDGRLSGARSVSGRWPGKRALLFDGASDYLEVDLGRGHRELSFSVWIRPQGLDHAINAIFDTNGWEPGGMHFQINRHGTPWFGVFEGDRSYFFSGVTAQPGVWIHLAVTLSTFDGTVALYADGEQIASSVLPEGLETLSPEVGRLANWAWDGVWKGEPRRNLRATIDEFTVWSRALTSEEIAALHRAGQPSLLPTR